MDIMVKMVTHTKLEILKFQNFKTFKNPETLPRSLKFAIHQNLEHDAIAVSNLVQNWSISTQISYCRDISSNECWIRAKWINDKNNNVYKTKRKEIIHMLYFTISNLKSAKTHKSRHVLVSRKIVYSGIST